MAGMVAAEETTDRAMLEEDPNDPMPDRMNIWTTLAGYGFGGGIIFLMFYLALPATRSLS